MLVGLVRSWFPHIKKTLVLGVGSYVARAIREETLCLERSELIFGNHSLSRLNPTPGITPKGDKVLAVALIATSPAQELSTRDKK